jgi:DNA-binding GntR family transcriptional regulator
MTSNASPIQPVRRATLTSLVTEQIREGIHRGAYQSGTQLNEAELAQQLGVSRGPVRESLQRLVQEGLLRSEPHRGVFVPVPSDEDIVDIYFAREAVESAAVRRIMGSPRPADLVPSLEDTVEQMALAVDDDDWASVADLDMRFHTLIVSAAGSNRLSRMFVTLVSETRLCLNLLTGVPRRGDLCPEHRQLAELIAGSDIETTLKTITQHFDEAVASLQEHWPAAAEDKGNRPHRPGRRPTLD